MSRIGKIPVDVPSGVEVTIDGQDVTVKGPKGTLSHTVAEPITVRKDDDGALAVERPNDERQNGAARPVAHADQQHGHRCHRGLREEARDRRRRLPRPGQGPRGDRAQPRLQPPGAVQGARGHHVHRRVADQAHRRGHRQAGRSARSPPTSARSASPSPTRARACATPASTSGARSERLVSKPWLSRSSTPSTRLRRIASRRVARSVVARRSRDRQSVRVWSSRARASTSSLRSSTTSRAARWRRRRRWRPTCARSTATRPPRPRRVGELVADRAKAAGVESVVFDRAGNKYAGRVAALADGAREGGLEF